MNAAIRREFDRLNDAPMASGETRRAVFEANERTVLQPLPANAWEWGEWISRKFAPNGHVCIERNYYSVPDGYIGQSVEARLGERIAVHPRKSGRAASGPTPWPGPSDASPRATSRNRPSPPCRA